MAKDVRYYLGELVIAFAALEDSLCEGLAQILNIEYENSKILFSAISFSKKIQILNALLRKYIGKDGERAFNGTLIYQLLTKANTLEAQRNMFIHSDWEYYINPKEKDVVIKRSKIRYSRKNIAKFQIEEIGEKELAHLKDIIDKLKECAFEVYGEFGQIGTDLGH
jgi:hypothetical protein